MTAIAGAIIAQIAITALSLPELSLTHWLARALFLIGVTSGCLSRYGYGEPGTVRPSLPAVLILSAPFVAVKISIMCLLCGLAIYQGFMWTRNLDANAGQHDNRDVFITFIVGTLACMFFCSVVFAAKGTSGTPEDRTGRTMSWNSSSRREEAVQDMTEQVAMTALDPSMAPPTAGSSLPPSDPMIHPRHKTDNIVSGDLAAALNAAAQAHIQCAEAGRLVALQYTRMSTNSQLANKY
ncbi:MAG: hypothetical protein Q9213_004346 [Squamulea squamosa]